MPGGSVDGGLKNSKKETGKLKKNDASIKKEDLKQFESSKLSAKSLHKVKHVLISNFSI